jgi:hypothetical protein
LGIFSQALYFFKKKKNRIRPIHVWPARESEDRMDDDSRGVLELFVTIIVIAIVILINEHEFSEPHRPDQLGSS